MDSARAAPAESVEARWMLVVCGNLPLP